MGLSLTFNDIAGYGVYYLVFAVLFLLVLASVLKWADDKWVLTFSGLILIFMAAFRAGSIDHDYGNYVTSFIEVAKPADYFLHYDSWIQQEPMAYLLPATAKLIFSADVYQQVVFFIFPLVSIAALFTALRKMSLLPAVSVMHFFCYYYMVHEMTQIRVAVACSLMLCAAYFHFHKKYKSFAVMCMLAPLFHYGGVMTPLLLLLKPDVFSQKKCFILLGFSLLFILIKPENIVAFFSGTNIPVLQKMDTTIDVLSSQNDEISIFNITNLMNIAMVSWLIFNYKKIAERTPYAFLFIKMQVLSIFLFGLFSFVPYLAFRMSEFWGIGNVITISYLVYAFRSRLEGYAVVALYSLALMVLSLHISGLLLPYKMVFG